MATNVHTNFLMGKRTDPDGSTRNTVAFDLWVGSNLLRLSWPDDIIALAEWVKANAAFMDDIAQQAHGWTTPSSAPTVFGSKMEEDLERESFEKGRR